MSTLHKEAPAKGVQSQHTKSWTVTEEVFDSLQLFLITTYPAIVRLASVPDSCQRSHQEVLHNKPNN